MRMLSMLLILSFVSGFSFFSQPIFAEERKPRERDLVALKAYLISLEDMDDETVDLGRHAEKVEKYIQIIEKTAIPNRQEKINQIKKMVEDSTKRKRRIRNLERFENTLMRKGILSDSQKKYFIDRSKETADDSQLDELKKEVENLEHQIMQDSQYVELYLKAIDSFDKIRKDMRNYYAEELANIWLNSKNFEGQVVPYFEKIEAEHVRKGGKAWKRPQNESVEGNDDSSVGESEQREDEAQRIQFINKQKALSNDLKISFKFLTIKDINKFLALINASQTTQELDAIRDQATKLNQENQLFMNHTERLRQQIQKSYKITDKDKQILTNQLNHAIASRSILEANQITQALKSLESKFIKVEQIPHKGNLVVSKLDPKPNLIVKHSQGWQGEKGKSTYRDKTLELVKGRWETISGSRYYFDNLGKPLTGLISIVNNKFYIDHEKGMVTGWRKISDKWHYFTLEGALKNQWKSIKGIWYYFDSSSEMVTGWQKIANKWYYFENSGAMATGWKQIKQKWYYLDKSGSMATSWKRIKNKWYYLEPSGAMASGWKKLNHKWYYLDQSGAMVTGWKYLNHKWYYFKDGGQMIVGKASIHNRTYYFDTQGALKK